MRSISKSTNYQTEFVFKNHTFLGDMPEAEGGTDQGPSPHDLIEASLAGCINMTLRVYANARDIPLEEVTVTLSMDDSSREKTVFNYSVEVRGEQLTQEQKDKLQIIATKCPIRRALSRPIEFASS